MKFYVFYILFYLQKWLAIGLLDSRLFYAVYMYIYIYIYIYRYRYRYIDIDIYR